MRSATAWLLAAGLMLPACGFQPLYRQGDDAVVVQHLGAVQIEIVPDRAGQQLRTLLQNRFNPSGTAITKHYSLAVKLTESVAETAIRKDETATRANLTLNAEYVLRTLQSGRVLVTGKTRSTNSYNILQSEFATLASANNARERAIRQVGEELQSHMAIFFQGESRRQAAQDSGGYR